MYLSSDKHKSTHQLSNSDAIPPNEHRVTSHVTNTSQFNLTNIESILTSHVKSHPN